MIRYIFKTALKYFWKNRIYNLFNILGLTISISSILIILLYIENEQKYDSAIHNKENIYRVHTDWATLPSFVGHYLKNEPGCAVSMVRIKMEDHDVVYNNQPFKIEKIGMADENFFDVFNFKFILGDRQHALEKTHSIVLTRSRAEQIFGNTNPLNKIVLLENKYPFTVTGVIEDPEYFHLPFDAVATLSSLKVLAYSDILEQKDGWDYFTYLVGNPSLSVTETETIINKKLEKFNYKRFYLTSLVGLYFAPPLYYEGCTLHGSRQVLFILFSIAVLLFILAGINFINLTNARSSTRIKDVGIKKLNGNPVIMHFLQFMIESVGTIFIAFLLSLVLIRIIGPYFNSLVYKQIDLAPVYSLRNLLFSFIIIVISGMLVGFFPAFNLNSVKPGILLKGRNNLSSKKSMLGRSLVVFQYFISILLISGTLIILKQLHSLKNKNLGFSAQQIVCVDINENIRGIQDAFKNEILKIPGVNGAAYSGNKMGNSWANWVNELDGKGCTFKVNSVEPDYFNLMGLTILKGRAFRSDDLDKCYIINETAAKNYNLENPLEKTMIRDQKVYPIIGVVKDFNFQSPQYPVEPVLFNFRDKKYHLINLKIETARASEVMKEIEKKWKEFCPNNVFIYNFQDDFYNRQYKSSEQFGILVGIGGSIAIIIACLGILGLSISSAEFKTKEIGIRKVNGAKVAEVMALLIQDFVKWVAIAFLIATPIAWYAMHRWLENFAYKTQMSWWIFALAGLLALIVALLTVSWQSWRAATRNPVESLRYE